MMTGSWLMVHFAVACAGSLVLAFALSMMLRLAARRWPALLAHRSVWLGGQAAVVLVFMLAIAPLPRSAIAPALILPAPATQQALTAKPDVLPPLTQATLALPPAPAQDPFDTVWRYLPVAWLAAYLAGLTFHAVQRLRMQRYWTVLLRQTRRVGDAELRAWPGMTPAQRALVAGRLTVRTIDLPISPMLHGVRRPSLLLPAHVSALDVRQQQMIVEHELTHWRRADPLWLTVSGVLALLFWFNRPYQSLDGALREAVELGCDDAVLSGASNSERQGYASALVAQLRRQAGWQAGWKPGWQAGVAFGSLGIVGRVLRMQAARPPRLSGQGRMLVGGGVAALALFGAALQPAFSSSVPSLAPAPSIASHASLETWRYPLDQPRVTSLYGVVSPSVPKGHHGIDLAAPRGTPVLAVAAGTVLEAAFHAAWGNYVRVDHGADTSSLLIHLDRIDVTPGQRVKAGDLLGTSGASGKATGPHLHLEYWEGRQRLDPVKMLPDLLQHTTRKAIARREAQGNPVPTDR
ncbi:beta-lactamase regulating signal transducer with metallopeptidase domain [Massilia sp. MP_M2]|uniref:M23/M56 family metallopeptidase n=1 Tax=Massilia sp. MP_M2 TaxID=3071713 RepID=UPI00319DEB79